jgi:hypothetical protein
MRHQASLASTEYRKVGSLPADELEKIMLRGEAPPLSALVGWEWRGLNTQGWARPAGIKKFIKGFFETDAGEVYGYNEPVVQNRLDQPWIAKPSDVEPKRFGYFVVEPVDPTARDNAYLSSLLLDYGRGGNPKLAVLRYVPAGSQSPCTAAIGVDTSRSYAPDAIAESKKVQSDKGLDQDYAASRPVRYITPIPAR